jgi:hypothetical protein
MQEDEIYMSETEDYVATLLAAAKLTGRSASVIKRAIELKKIKNDSAPGASQSAVLTLKSDLMHWNDVTPKRQRHTSAKSHHADLPIVDPVKNSHSDGPIEPTPLSHTASQADTTLPLKQLAQPSLTAPSVHAGDQNSTAFAHAPHTEFRRPIAQLKVDIKKLARTNDGGFSFRACHQLSQT